MIILCLFVFLNPFFIQSMDHREPSVQQLTTENDFLEQISTIQPDDSKKIEELLGSSDLEYYLKSDNKMLLGKLNELFVSYNNMLPTESPHSFMLSKVLLTLNNKLTNKDNSSKKILKKPEVSVNKKEKIDDGFVLIDDSSDSNDEDLSVYDTVFLTGEVIEKNKRVYETQTEKNKLKSIYENLIQKVVPLFELKKDIKNLAEKKSYASNEEIKQYLDRDILLFEYLCTKNESNLEKAAQQLQELSTVIHDDESILEKDRAILQKKINNRWKKAEKLKKQEKELEQRNTKLSSYENWLEEQLQQTLSLRQKLTEDQESFEQQRAIFALELQRTRKANFALGTIIADNDLRSGTFAINNENMKHINQ